MINKIAKNSTAIDKEKKSRGRPKGSLNKDTAFIFECCEKHGFDPIEVLIFIAKNDWEQLGYEARSESYVGADGNIIERDIISIKERLDATKTLVGFMYPKRKSIEVKDDSGNNLKPIVLAYDRNNIKKPDDE